MDYNQEYIQQVQNIRTTLLNNIDFRNGAVQDLTNAMIMNGICADVKYKGNIRFRFCYRWSRYWYAVMKNQEFISPRYLVKNIDEHLYKKIQKLINEIENGDFINKKTASEKADDIIHARNLTSYMNKTKWQEFLYAMTKEMPLAIPYDYKTLFEDEREELLWGTSYDCESFNYYCFKSIEWVKLKPKFLEYIYKGRLIDDDLIPHDVEKEFCTLMNKYSIPYEYDSSEEIYVIYGYK